MAVLLSIQNFAKTFGAHPLFENLSFGLFERERLGMIGPNGSGKSTLLKIMVGLEKQDEGTMSLRKGTRIGYLPQQETFSPAVSAMSVEEALADALQGQKMEDYERDAEISMMIEEMAFENPSQKVQTLSGGWKKRLALA